MKKHLLIPSRMRVIPRQFSWVDQRLIRDQYIERCDTTALALYLFLLTVADAKGLSYYADHSIARRLSLSEQTMRKTRESLISAGLIAYEKPLYQVLALDSPVAAPTRGTPSLSRTTHSEGFRSLAEVLRQARGYAS